MKNIFIGLLALGSVPAYSQTITHETCQLHRPYYDQELNMVLEQKGYVLYTGIIQANTLLLDIYSSSKSISSHSAQYGVVWAKSTRTGRLYRFDGKDYFMIAEEKVSFLGWMQSENDRKPVRSIKNLLSKLPNCVIK